MLKNTVQVFFKKQGFRLDQNAATYIVEVIEKVNQDQHIIVMKRMIEELLEQNLGSNFITLDIIRNSVKSLTSTGSVTLFQVIDVFTAPLLKFNSNLKRFYTEERNPKNSVFFSDNACDKSNILKDRYSFILERLLRNPNFSLNFCDGDNNIGLKSIDFLLSGGSKAYNVKVLGMLTQKQDDIWCMEDVTGIVKINIDNAEYCNGLVLEGSFVLAEGIFEDGIFKVFSMGLPPLESPQASRNAIMSGSNYFGGDNGCVKTCTQILKLCNKNISGKTLVFLSEIWLDKEIVYEKLEKLFSGYTSLKPGAFIFCGDFLSPDMATSNESTKLKFLKRAFKRVVLLFATYKELALNSHLVFVPGPNDPYPSDKNALPRYPLPADILLDHVFTGAIDNFKESEREELKKRVIMSSNPCRITYYNKEIVVFRDTIGQKVYCHCMYIPSEDQILQETQNVNDSLNISANNTMADDSERNTTSQNIISQANFLEHQLVRTLLSQAHLMPLPQHVSPIYWTHDQALRLFPAPDLVVLADPNFASFEVKVNECTMTNTPSFSHGDGFNFKIYYLYNDEIESCSIGS